MDKPSPGFAAFVTGQSVASGQGVGKRGKKHRSDLTLSVRSNPSFLADKSYQQPLISLGSFLWLPENCNHIVTVPSWRLLKTWVKETKGQEMKQKRQILGHVRSSHFFAASAIEFPISASSHYNSGQGKGGRLLSLVSSTGQL
jgi:hypothetical protein